MVDASFLFGSMFEPLTQTVSLFTKVVSGLVGGIFGVYLIMLYLKFKEYKKLVEIMTEIKHELKKLNEQFDKKEQKISPKTK